MTSSPDPSTATPVPADTCDACVHSLTTHDAIARRFCRATITTAVSRSCVCSV